MWSHNSYYVNTGEYYSGVHKYCGKACGNIRWKLKKLPKMNAYSRLHRFRSPATLLKSQAKNLQNGPFFAYFWQAVFRGSILTRVSDTTCAIMPEWRRFGSAHPASAIKNGGQSFIPKASPTSNFSSIIRRV